MNSQDITYAVTLSIFIYLHLIILKKKHRTYLVNGFHPTFRSLVKLCIKKYINILC